MKKIILAVAILMLAAPAMATVDINIVDEGDGWAAIKYASDANVSGFGLNITVTAGNIIEIKDYFVGECDGTNQGFGIFPASFNRYIDAGDPNWDDPNYTPVADVCDSGALDGLGTPGITIEMGALYEDGNQPGLEGVLCRLKVSEDCNMSAVGNPTRGNVVLEDANEADLDVTTAATDIPISLGCYYGPDKAEWLAVESPESWCNLRQCHGDADNESEQFSAPHLHLWTWVGDNDIDILSDAYRKLHPSETTIARLAADFDHASEQFSAPHLHLWTRCGDNDIAVLAKYYRKLVGDPCEAPADCQTDTPVVP